MAFITTFAALVLVCAVATAQKVAELVPQVLEPAIPDCSTCRVSQRLISPTNSIPYGKLECKAQAEVIQSSCNGCCYGSYTYNPFTEYGKCTCCAPSCFSKTSVKAECSDGKAYNVPYDVATKCDCRGCGLEPAVPSYPNILTATCDDSMRVWIDGVEQTHNTNGVHAWSTPTRYEYSRCAKVIAIQCIDVADAAIGLLASTSTGVLTDGTWKCSGSYESGWETVSFNDAPWGGATVHGPNPTYPWSAVAGIPAAANWIGFLSKYNTSPTGTGPSIYCRKNL